MKKLLAIALFCSSFISEAQQTKLHKDNTIIRFQDTTFYEHFVHISPNQTFVFPIHTFAYKMVADTPCHGNFDVSSASSVRETFFNRDQMLIRPDTVFHTINGVKTATPQRWHRGCDGATLTVQSSAGASFDLYYISFYKIADGIEGNIMQYRDEVK